MIFFVSDAKTPLRYISCGNLIKENDFIHPKRNIDSFVLIVVDKGTLHITQNEHNYNIGPNQFLILYPHQNHAGAKPSEGFLSYYWVHFELADSADCTFYDFENLNRYISSWRMDPAYAHSSDVYIMPECGQLSLTKKVNLLFRQLLDISKNENPYSPYLSNYALSLLMMEISQEFLDSFKVVNPYIPNNIIRITEWLKANYDKPLTVQMIADEFNYNPDYLSSVFKKHTGYSLTQYINKTRISISKNILMNNDSSIKEVAYLCGFYDEKYYMKLFKKYEDMTPTQYREAFFRKKLNKK